jgi:hypothetical protein
LSASAITRSGVAAVSQARRKVETSVNRRGRPGPDHLFLGRVAFAFHQFLTVQKRPAPAAAQGNLNLPRPRIGSLRRLWHRLTHYTADGTFRPPPAGSVPGQPRIPRLTSRGPL